MEDNSSSTSLYRQAERIGNNIFQTGVSTGWKVMSRAKALAGIGDEGRYRKIFNRPIDEELKKAVVCDFLAKTSIRPISGTLYLSNKNAAFASNGYVYPSGLGPTSSSYQKELLVPLGDISHVDTREKHHMKIRTVDGHEYHFTGFKMDEFIMVAKYLLPISQ